MPFFIYLAIFVYDGEKVFIHEPRNEVAKWLLTNAEPATSICWWGHNWMPGFNHVLFPDKGRPQILVIEMHHANHYLSGMGLKNSFPKDYRLIFDGRSQARVETFQAVFKGTSEYKEVARFGEGYFMPDYVIVDNLIGNRSRNYVAEIVIFKKNNKNYTKR